MCLMMWSFEVVKEIYVCIGNHMKQLVLNTKRMYNDKSKIK